MMRAFDFSRRYAPVAALAVLLTGCAVGPDYQRPDAVLPGEFKAIAPEQAKQPEAPIKKDWWTLFEDRTLNDLVAQALAYNQDLLAAVARVEEAEGLAREANALFFPQVDLGAASTRSQVSEVTAIPLSSTTPRLRDTRRAALATSFEIDVWGKLRRANEAARAQVLATRYARDTVELSVAGLVTSSYLALRATDAGLALTRSTLEVRAKGVEIVKSRLDAGTASPIDLHQAEGSLAAAEVQLSELRRLRALAQNQLALLTGTPALRLEAGDLRQLPLPPVPPAGLPSALLEGRPDIRQAEETLISANAQIGVARAALFPTLSLTGSLGSESAALANLFSSAAGTWSLGLAAAMPIFDAGRNAARIDQASARQRQALAGYQKTVQTAFKEVNDALIGLRENAESEQAQQRRVVAAQKTLELSQVRYEAGYSGFLEVLDAQRSANETLLASVTIRQSRLNSAVDLFKALGGGWQDRHQAESDENTGRQIRAAAQ